MKINLCVALTLIACVNCAYVEHEPSLIGSHFSTAPVALRKRLTVASVVEISYSYGEDGEVDSTFQNTQLYTYDDGTSTDVITTSEKAPAASVSTPPLMAVSSGSSDYSYGEDGGDTIGTVYPMYNYEGETSDDDGISSATPVVPTTTHKDPLSIDDNVKIVTRIQNKNDYTSNAKTDTAASDPPKSSNSTVVAPVVSCGLIGAAVGGIFFIRRRRNRRPLLSTVSTESLL